MDTVTPYSTSVRMEQRLSEEPWDCLFGSDSITDAIQYRSEMFHMDICCCGNTGSSLDCLGLGFGFNGDLLSEIGEDPAGFSCEKSRSSASNLEDLNLDSDSELALTLDPNLILPHNGPIRSPTPGSEVPMLGASTKRRGIVALEEDETENESEPERTENDEDSEEEEEEEEEESEENEHNETEYETAEEVTEEEEDEDEDEDEDEEAEDEEDEDDEVPAGVRRPPPPSSLETPASIPPSALAATAPTIHLTRVPMQQHPKIGAMKVHDIKVLAASPAAGQTSHHIRKQVYNNNLHDIGPGTVTTVMIQAKREKDPAGGAVENPYPKPAYSYSCLIAMALKNSRTGSLPVSEIYNFMCRHFPYFKTAPNGWKNSVRHNLSLNKCFEKIEKPPGSGSQRKGCLWAIHPSKIAKMDEEVRKWSRKDPVAIKRAMVCPDQLELLERGEMRYEGDEGHEEMYEDAESYASSENETVGPDETDETVMNGDEEARLLEAGDEARFEAANDEEATRPDVDVVDDDIVVEELYDDIEVDDDVTAAGDVLDTRLLPGGGGGFRQQPREQQQSFVYVSCQKRPKTLAGPQNDYVYQQIDAPTPRRKAHVAQLGTPEAGIP